MMAQSSGILLVQGKDEAGFSTMGENKPARIQKAALRGGDAGAARDHFAFAAYAPGLWHHGAGIVQIHLGGGVNLARAQSGVDGTGHS